MFFFLPKTICRISISKIARSSPPLLPVPPRKKVKQLAPRVRQGETVSVVKKLKEEFEENAKFT